MAARKLVGESPWLLNINIPNLPLQAMRSLKLCRLGRRHAAERVITQESPRGDVMYWIGGAGAAKDDAEGTDFHATAAGHVAVTPLKVDLTDHQNLGYWAQTAAHLAGAMPPRASDAAAPSRFSGPHSPGFRCGQTDGCAAIQGGGVSSCGHANGAQA